MRARGGVRTVLIGFLWSLIGLAPLGASAAGGRVIGIAKDALDRPLPSVQARLEAGDGRVVGQTTTDEQGRFSFADVAPGTYVVVAAKDGFETATAVVTVGEGGDASAALTLASRAPLDVAVAAKRLEEARIQIQPRIGASTYEFSKTEIERQPGAENQTLSQVLLKAPGVTLDTTSQGSIHVRNEHANVQYRINGVALPEGVSLFGQAGGLSPRLASRVELITGALPAEFGLRTAGIVDVQTKSGAFEPGGYVGIYGGSNEWVQPSAEYRGSLGRFNYYLSGDYLHNSIGITPATPDHPIHDDTSQGHGFAYLEYLLDASSKVSAIFGSFVGHFQIPNSRNATPAFTVNGIDTFDSAKANETQLEQNYYGVLSYLKAKADLAYQIAVFARYTDLHFHPDPLADLIFNGIAQDFHRSSIATGLQGDGSYVLTPSHTLRAGLLISAEHVSVQTTSSVEPAGGPDTPFNIFDSQGKTAYSYSLYAQDAWKVFRTVTINGGGRFDYYAGFRDEWQISPRLNAVWMATPTTTIHAGYARYFTPPPLVFTQSSTLNKFVGTTAEPATFKNTTIKAERANYLDAGVTQQIVPGLKVGLDLYYKQAEHQLDDGQFGAPVFVTPFNYKQGYNYGIELSATYVVGDFSAYGNLAAARQIATRVETAQALFSQEDLAFIQNHYIHTDHDQLITASAGASYRWMPLGTLTSFDFLDGSGLRRTVHHPNDATVKPYQTANVGIAQPFTLPGIGKMEARFDVFNLWDEQYVIRNGTGVGVFAKQFGPRRAFYGGLKKEF
jgi:TonB dependent receptor/Carboxypeptidase regulatory-like domain/TonB-dependent Receptor Plug Domain